MGFIYLYENHIFMSNSTIMKTTYYCPRCGTKEISEYDETFECTKCRDNNGFPLEFEKKYIGNMPDEEILALREQASFTDAFEELRDEEKRKKLDEYKAELAYQRSLLASGNTTDAPGKIKTLRRTIARIKTFINIELQGTPI